MKSKILLGKIDAYNPERSEEFVRESVGLFSGQGPLFGPGNRVLLKPNLLRGFDPDRCDTTHPAVVEKEKLAGSN